MPTKTQILTLLAAPGCQLPRLGMDQRNQRRWERPVQSAAPGREMNPSAAAQLFQSAPLDAAADTLQQRTLSYYLKYGTLQITCLNPLLFWYLGQSELQKIKILGNKRSLTPSPSVSAYLYDSWEKCDYLWDSWSLELGVQHLICFLWAPFGPSLVSILGERGQDTSSLLLSLRRPHTDLGGEFQSPGFEKPQL